MDRQRGGQDLVLSMCVCVCVCVFALLLCRDRWLIEYRAMWVSVCVNESGQGGAANLGAVRTDGRWGGPQAARMCRLLEEDESCRKGAWRKKKGDCIVFLLKIHFLYGSK